MQLADAAEHGHWQASDINTKANPLVEADHGPSIGTLSHQFAGNLSQLIQAIASFAGEHQGIPPIGATVADEAKDLGTLAANLFHHQG